MATRYQAAPGDSLHSVALAFYGDAAMSVALAAANGMTTGGQLADGVDQMAKAAAEPVETGVLSGPTRPGLRHATGRGWSS